MRNFHYNAPAIIARPRFNGGAPDVAAVIASFDRLNAANDRRFEELGASIDELNGTIAAMKIGGGGDVSRAKMSPAQKAYATAWDAWFRRGKGEEALQDLAVKASLQVGSDPDGGYMAPPVVDSTIQDQLIAVSPMRSLAQVDSISIGGEYTFLVNKRGVNSGWVGENQARPETDTMKIAAIAMSEGEIYAEPGATQRMLDDSMFDVANFLSANITDEFALQEGVTFVSGDGNGKPQGFLSRPVSTALDAVRPLGTIQYVATGAADGFAPAAPADVLTSLLYSLRAPYKAGPGVAWLMNSNTVGVIRLFKDGTGRYLWNDALTAGQPATLLGYPVVIDENMPDIGANSYPVAIGNWRRGYRILDRGGVRILRDPFTAKPKVLFYSTKRVGGSVADTNAIKLLKCAAN